MKIINNILLYALLLNANIMHAYKPGAKKTTTSSRSTRTPQPSKPSARAQKARIWQEIPAADSYISALNIIRNNMSSDFVIKNNALTPEFINFVTNLNLSVVETKALLEAGVNLHATWNGDNQTIKNRLIAFNKTIQSIVPTQQQNIPVKSKAPISEAIPVKPIISKKITQPIIPKNPKQIQSNPIMSPTLISSQHENYLTTNNLIVILDPEKSETEGGAMTTTMLIALYQEAAPIIITSNLLESVINIQQKLGPIDMQKIRECRSKDEMFMLGLSISKSHNLFNVKSLGLGLISSLNFNGNNLNYYFHKSEELILIIPKKFLNTHLTNKEQLNLHEQAQACGFNPNIIKPITHPTIENLKKELLVQKSLSIKPENFVHHLATMLALQKKDGHLISPEQNIKWTIYLTGHGNHAQSIGKLRQQLKNIKDETEIWQDFLKTYPKRIDAKKRISIFQTEIKTLSELLKGKETLPDSQLLPESAHIAGIKTNQFNELMRYFDKNINMGYLHYSTCFAGGSNQSFVNDTLSSLNINFIISAEGLDESFTIVSPRYTVVDHEPRINITNPSYTDFFRLINLFITDPELFVKIKQKKQDPIMNIIRTLTPEDVQENQPFIRFPGTSSFQGVSLGQHTKVLTQTMIQVHEIENKPIDMSSPAIETVVVNTPRITTQLKLGKKRNFDYIKKIYFEHVAIVIPSPKNISPTYEAIQVFKDIDYEDNLQSFLFNCIYRNTRLYTQTFVINNLSGILYNESNIPDQSNSTIRNLIIQMKRVIGNNLKINDQPLLRKTLLKPEDISFNSIGINIDVAFELNNNIYQLTFGISNLKNPEDLYKNMLILNFRSTPQQLINMESLATKFLKSEEISQVKKPITLESIAQFIDSKIDEKNKSMTSWSETNKESFLKTVTKKQTPK